LDSITALTKATIHETLHEIVPNLSKVLGVAACEIFVMLLQTCDVALQYFHHEPALIRRPIREQQFPSTPAAVSSLFLMAAHINCVKFALFLVCA
jgi:hypothetical protein